MTERSDIAVILGIPVRDAALFQQALTHGSVGTRERRQADYQRLEFLGDRVLGLTAAETLYRRHPELDEGALSARLNVLVSRATCADVARQVGLAPMVQMGKQARDDGGRDSDNILGDVVEALIGAAYLDSGLDVAQEMIVRLWGNRFDQIAQSSKHPKSALLEWAAAHRRKPPEYTIINRDGPDHAPRFTVTARIARVGEASATGTSKQDAEKLAAAALLSQLEQKS